MRSEKVQLKKTNNCAIFNNEATLQITQNILKLEN